ncbi:hypothetical protein PM082_007773 [Marasmius tenuissimus]|nr:hypothetical protein PM082_007773 [Marasmius tenuissimus]
MSLFSALEAHSLEVGIFSIFLAYRYVSAYRVWSKLHGFPTVGHDGVFLSYKFDMEDGQGKDRRDRPQTHISSPPPLRNEVETVLKKEEWTKAAMVPLRLMESFLKESQRRKGTPLLAMGRETLKDFRFSDHTVVPAGTLIQAAMYETHHNEEMYPDPNDFVPSRFADMRAKEGESMKYQMVTPITEWLFFGTGKHAWYVLLVEFAPIADGSRL